MRGSMYQDRIIRNGLPVISVASRHTNIVLLISGYRYRSPIHATDAAATTGERDAPAPTGVHGASYTWWYGLAFA